jgi:uroporphyrinogen decarboxylase
MLSEPAGFHQLLEKITALTIEYINLQIEAGVDAIQIFDSWASHLAHPQFQEFSQAYMEKLMKGIKNKNIPIILFCKGSSVFAHELASLKPACISLDWNGSLPAIRRQIPHPIALQGNMDPLILQAPLLAIRHEASRLIASMKGDSGYVFNLGHGILPETPVEAVRTLVETVHNA